MLDLLHSDASIVDPDGSVHAAADLRRAAAAAANLLRETQAGRGDIVVLPARDDARFLADLFGVWACGATAACLDPDLPPQEVERVLRFLAPRTIISAGTIAASPIPPQNRAELDGPSLVLMTSGTTGEPKGVVIGEAALRARLALNVEAIGHEALQRSLVTLPLHFGHGLVGNTLTPLFAGGTVFLAGRGLALATGLGPQIDREGVTFLSSTPSFWRIVLRTSAPPRNGTLRRVHVGSAPLDALLWAKIASWAGCDVVNCYGMSETANWFSGGSSADGFDDGRVGRPWGGRAGIVGADGGVVAAEGEGEIAVRTPALMSFYLDRPDITEAAMPHGWFRTGDTGRIDASGEIVLTGRIKEEINRGGIKVQPADIDRVLDMHPDVAEACAFALPDPASGEMVGVAVRMKAGKALDAQALRAWCMERLRREAVPERFFPVNAMPVSGRGKVSRDAVRRAVTGAD